MASARYCVGDYFLKYFLFKFKILFLTYHIKTI
jgi:hypothetical protein